MRAEWHALAAVDTDKGLGIGIKVNGVNRAGFGTISALYAEPPFDNHPPALSLGKGACGAGQRTRRRIAC